MSTEEFLKGVEQEESASRQRQFESHETTASALAERELATTQHESSAAQQEPPATEQEPLAAHDQHHESSAAQQEPPATEQEPLAAHDQHHLADEAIVSNRLVLPPTFHSFVWVGWMDGVEDGWGGWMGWMDGVDTGADPGF